MENKENDEIILVLGIINATGKMLYWKDDKGSDIGDYAIVKNGTGYDLIKVIGIMKIDKNSVPLLTHTQYENMKEVVKVIPSIDIEEKC